MRPVFVLALSSILLFQAAFAETGPSDQDAHDVPEIVITADPLGDIDGHFVAPVTVLDQSALRTQSMRTIGETVAGQLGVTSSDFGASVGRPVIRGLGGARVRVLENGIGAMDVSTVSADHGVSIEPLLANQIEIFRGPATLLYGSGASGGLVNIANGRILSRPPDGLEGMLYGHHDTASDGWLAAFKFDAGIGRHFGVHVDGLKRDTDDLEIPGFAEVMPDEDERAGTLPNSSGETENFAAGASAFGARGFVGFNVSYLANEYGVPGAHHDEGDQRSLPEAGTRIDQELNRYDLEAAFEIDLAFIDRVKTRWGYNDYEHDEIEASGALGTRVSNEEWEGRVEVIHRPLGPMDGVVGLQIRDRDFSAVGEEAFVPAASLDSIAVFLFEKADFGRLQVDAGARFERQESESRAGSPAHDLISVSGGAAYNYRAGYTIGFFGTRSQRAPTIEELFAGGPHLASNTFEIGDVDLGAETSMNVDLYWRKVDGRFRFDFTLFYNDVQDFVFLRSSDRNLDGRADRVEEDFLETGTIVTSDEALLLVNQVQRDARFWGFELEGEMTLFDDARGLLDLRIWTDYVEGEFADDSRVPRMPPLRFGGGLKWQRGPAYAGFTVVRVTTKDATAVLETDTDGYTMVNLDAGYTVKAGEAGEITIFARGSNLADEEARRHTSFVKDLATLPGISGTIGVRAQF